MPCCLVRCALRMFSCTTTRRAARRRLGNIIIYFEAEKPFAISRSNMGGQRGDRSVMISRCGLRLKIEA